MYGYKRRIAWTVCSPRFKVKRTSNKNYAEVQEFNLIALQNCQLISYSNTNGLRHEQFRRSTSDLHSSELLSETLKALTTLSNKTTKAKRGVTFPINVMLQQTIGDGDREEIKKIINKRGKNMLDLKDPTGMPLLLSSVP